MRPGGLIREREPTLGYFTASPEVEASRVALPFDIEQ